MKAIAVAPVRKSILVAAPPARAFEVFAKRFDSWWPRDHHIGTSAMTEAVIEPRAGGRWYEKGEDGAECEWGRVLAFEPPRRLLLSWRINSRFVPDETVDSEVEVLFRAEGDGTRVDLEQRIRAPDAEPLRNAVDSPRGWSGLLAIYAKAAERK